MLENLTSAVSAGTLTIQNILICTLASLVFGVVIALVYMYRNTFSKGFVVTIAILPSIVQVVIMMVNGNLGTGVAVAGAFSLVRFRSVPGSARDITTIFFAMAIGLATGTDQILFALVFLVLIGLANIFLFASPFGDPGTKKRMLKITIPETMDYEHIFDDLFEKYTSQSSLEKVRTVNMGSLYELCYDITLKSGDGSKAFIDEIRCRNGNLNILLGRSNIMKEEL